MRKILVLVVAEIMIAAGGFLTEYLWPAGDLRWAYVLLTGAVLIPLLYSPEIWRFILRQASKASKPARTISRSSSDENPGSPQYVDATVGTRCRIIHDMTIHNRQCVIGSEEYCFHTIWSRGGKSSVHAYSTGPSMAGVATKEGVMSVTQVHDPEAWKYGADSVLVEKGQVVTFKNAAGNYLPVRIDRIEKDILHLDVLIWGSG